jgi:hypothetical protein
MTTPRQFYTIIFIWTNCIIAFGQNKIFLATYNTGLISGKFYDTNLQVTKQITINVEKENGNLTADKYHTAGDPRAMQLSSDASKLYFFMYDGNDGGCEVDEADSASWTTLFCYDIKDKKLTKIFSPSRSGYMIWALFENRNSIVFYDYQSEYFVEYNFKNQKSDSLVKIHFTGSDNQFDAFANSFEFYYPTRDSIYRLSYNLSEKKAEKTFIYPHHSFSSSYGGKTIVFFWPKEGNLARVINNDSIYSNQVSKSNVGTIWRNTNSFFIMEEKALSIYDYKLNKIGSVTLERPHIYERLSNGLFIYFRENNKKVYSVIDFNLKNPIILKDIQEDNFKLITTYDK